MHHTFREKESKTEAIYVHNYLDVIFTYQNAVVMESMIRFELLGCIVLVSWK